MINTKYLDNEIELLNSLERNQELTEYGKNKLTSFKEIKKQLTLIDVGSSLPLKMVELNNVYIDDCDDKESYYVAGRFAKVFVEEKEFDKNKCVNN